MSFFLGLKTRTFVPQSKFQVSQGSSFVLKIFQIEFAMLKKTYSVFALCLLTGTLLFAQSPFLDSSFGVNGRFTHKFTEGFDRLWCTALQADGKILGGGNSATLTGGQRASLLRVNSNGTLDATFGNGGEWISNDPTFGILQKIIVQPDGKILLTGSSVGTFKVVRLTQNGNYDIFFGSGGKVSFAVWPSTDFRAIYDMLLQPNGKILLSGRLTSNFDEHMITRLRADGSLDASFGTSGSIIIPASLLSNGSSYDGSLHLGLKSDNKILAAIAVNKNSTTTGYVLQYSIGGIRDTTFGENGVGKILDFGTVRDLFVLPGDELYLLADNYDGFFSAGLYKLNANGIRDTSFAINGVGKLPFFSAFGSSSTAESGYLQSDGKVVVFGGPVNGIGFLGRFDEYGFPDQSFGTNGTIAPETSYEIFYQGFAQPDGKIVTVGRYLDSNSTIQCSILRYLGSNSVGVIDVPSAISSALVYPNPISGQTVTIAYELPAPSPVAIELLDIQGKTLRTLLKEERAIGKNEEFLDLPPELANGIYLLNIQTNKGNSVVKLIVQR